jgi:hypothetical protein
MPNEKSAILAQLQQQQQHDNNIPLQQVFPLQPPQIAAKDDIGAALKQVFDGCKHDDR